MKSNLKTESIPLLDSDVHDLKDASDYSSSSIHYSTDYGTYQAGSERNRDTRNYIESITNRYSVESNGNYKRRSYDIFDFKHVTVSWSEINCYAPEYGKRFFGGVKETGLFKQLLFDINGVIRTGKLTGIMGASGAGKSTLLNILTCRNLGKLRVDGEVKVNGYAMHSNIKSVSAYVQQLDIFWGRLKVREHLLYNAVLRMGSKYSMEQKTERVDHLIHELGLSLVENDFINSSSYKVQGLAGSEKKLLSIACELLVDPPILFLDEPTTGLDSEMANKVIKILANLAKKGKCILCTIHQPSSHIFEKFNEIYLIAEGRLIFQGSREHALDFFGDIGFPCADNYNPADHYIHTMAIKSNHEANCRAKIIYMARKFKDTSEYGFLKKEILEINDAFCENESHDVSNQMKNLVAFKASFWEEVKIQTWKNCLDQVRDPKIFGARFFQNFISCLIMSIFYFQQNYDQIGVNNINGVLYNLITNVTFLTALQVNTFVNSLKFYFREHQNGMVRAGSFFIALNISEMPLFVTTTITTVFLVYFCVGFYMGISQFFMFSFMIIILYQYSYSINVTFISIIFTRLDVVINVAILVRIIMMYLGGYLINDASIPAYLRWLKYISWHRYGYEVMVLNQWTNVKEIECGSSYRDSCYRTGQDVINFNNFSSSNMTLNISMMIGLTIVFRIFGFLILKFRSRERKLN